ncbi:Uncharacterized protein SCF082_LOCUS16058 [Durusdinium trenchii]|uniref:Ion transport domain-containing protein n=1 Tax=Durusdinium trenchii TaxID=1381693 RepID=A0ABP0K957_9DINO
MASLSESTASRAAPGADAESLPESPSVSAPSLSTRSVPKITRKPTHFSVVDAVRIDAEGFRNRRAYWITESPEVMDCYGRAIALVDSGIWEIIVTLAICADMSLTIASFVLPPEESDSLGLFLAGGFVLLILVVDVVLRIMKERCGFFLKILNLIEFVVAIVGLVTVVVEVEERLTVGSDGIKQPGASLGRTIRPVLRVFRIFRGFFSFFASRGGIRGRINKGVDRLFDHIVRKQLVEFLLMPKQNIKIQPSQGILHIERAQLRSSRLNNLHLPLILTAGILDMVHLELKMGKLNAGHHRLMVLIQNVILVMGPGRSEERSSDWNFHDVKAAKTKTIKLASKLLEAFAKPPKQPAKPPPQQMHGSVRVQKEAGSSWLRRKLAKLLRDILNNGMQIAIHDFEIRYEDENSGICGPYRILGGFVVDSLQLRAVSAGQGHGDEQHLFRAKGDWRAGLGQPEDYGRSPSSWRTMSFRNTFSNPLFGKTAPAPSIFDFSHGVHGGLHGYGIKVFWEMFPMDRKCTMSSDVLKDGLGTTTATSQFRLRLQEDSGCSVTEFLKTRKFLKMWERLRYGICTVVMQRMLEEKQGMDAVYVSSHRLREKARRLRDIIGQYKYLVEPCNFSIHFVARPFRGNGDEPHLDLDVNIQELSLLLDMKQLKGLAAILGYLQRWMRHDALFQWKPVPAEFRNSADISGCGLTRGRLLWAFALKLVLQSIHPKYFWTSLAWIHMRRGASIRQALFEALSARTVDQERVQVLQVSLPLIECLAVRREFLIQQARRKKEESYFKREGNCCPCRRKTPEEMAEAQEEEQDEEEGDSDIIDDESEENNSDSGEIPPNTEAIEVLPDIKIAPRSPTNTAVSAGTPEKEEKEQRRMSLWGSQKRPKDKLDISGLKEFMQIHVSLRKFYFDLLYPPGPNGRRRAMLRLGALWCESLGAKGAPYRLWSCLAPPLVVVTLPVGDPMHKHPALGLQVQEASAVFSAAPKDGPELRTFMLFDEHISREKSQKAGLSRPVLQLRAAKLKPNPISEEEARATPWGRTGVKSIPAPWRMGVCVEPFRATICKSFILRVKDFLWSYLIVPNLDPAELTKRADPSARTLEDPCHLWVQLQEIRKKRHQRHRHLKFGRRLEMAMGLRGPFADGQRFFGTVIFPGGFSATVLELYHENRWMRLTINAPPGMNEFHRLGWPVDGSGGYRPFGALEPCRSIDGWWFETEEQSRHFAQAQADGGRMEGSAWEATEMIDVEHFSALAGQPPRLAGRGLPRQALQPSKVASEQVAESKERTLLSCAAQVAGPTAIIATSMAVEIGRNAAARLAASMPSCGQVEKAALPTQPRQRKRRSSLSLPTGTPQRVGPFKTLEEAALTVTMEVLPKGALGLPAPSLLPAWWEELGLVRSDVSIASR